MSTMYTISGTLPSADLSDFADLGTYCQFDLFGIELSYYQLAADCDFPSDAQRMDLIRSAPSKQSIK